MTDITEPVGDSGTTPSEIKHEPTDKKEKESIVPVGNTEATGEATNPDNSANNSNNIYTQRIRTQVAKRWFYVKRSLSGTWLIVIITGILAYYNWRLVQYASDQSGAAITADSIAARSLELTMKNLKYENRPYLAVKSFDIDSLTDHLIGKKMKTNIIIRNYGKTPAFKTILMARIIGDTIPINPITMRDSTNISRFVIGSGDTIRFPLTGGTVVTPLFIYALQKEFGWVFYEGLFEYEDYARHHYITTFCVKYSGKAQDMSWYYKYNDDYEDTSYSEKDKMRFVSHVDTLKTRAKVKVGLADYSLIQDSIFVTWQYYNVGNFPAERVRISQQITLKPFSAKDLKSFPIQGDLFLTMPPKFAGTNSLRLGLNPQAYTDYQKGRSFYIAIKVEYEDRFQNKHHCWENVRIAKNKMWEIMSTPPED